MKNLTVILIIVILLFFGQAYATSGYADITTAFLDTCVAVGSDFTIDIYFENNSGDMVGASIPFAIYSPDASVSNIIHRNVSAQGGISVDSVDPGGSYNDYSVLTYNGWDATLWNMANWWFGWSWDGVLPDTVNFMGITLHGWKISPMTHYFSFALQVDEIGWICIDSIDHADNSYDWLFDYEVTFGGPYCWKVCDHVCGDVNGDLSLDIFDIYMLIDYYICAGPPPDPEFLGDMNCDGKINIVDIAYLIDFLYYDGNSPCCDWP